MTNQDEFKRIHVPRTSAPRAGAAHKGYAALAGSLLLALSFSGWAQTGALPSLALGSVRTGTLAGEQTNAYQIVLTAGQFAAVTVTQPGMAVTLKIFGPDGKLLAAAEQGAQSREQQRPGGRPPGRARRGSPLRPRDA
ncbi:MAG: hypothetical protein HYR56_09680 [Acidobacteria bacterium]|nr:hypothetical protein [Acidobacteriota bacterium]